MSNQDDDVELTNLPLGGGWMAETLPAPPGREQELDPQETDDRLRELLYASYDESLLWRRCYPPSSCDKTDSIFGGRPLLSDQIAWPRSPDGSGSMMFLAQISLKSLPDFSLRELLPQQGALYFFVGWSESNRQQNGVVLYDPAGPAGVERDLPKDIKSIYKDRYPKECEWVDRTQLACCRYHTAFPRFFVSPVVLKTFSDHHPYHHWGETGGRYQRLWRKEQSKEIIAKLGLPHSRWWDQSCDYFKRADGTLEPYSIGGKLQPAPEAHNINPRIGAEPWMPDDRWPYSWVFAEIFCALLVSNVEKHWSGSRAQELEELEKLSRRSLPTLIAESLGMNSRRAFFRTQLDRYEDNISSAKKWLSRCSAENTFASLPDRDRQLFRSWVMSLGRNQDYLDPDYDQKQQAQQAAMIEWKQRGAIPSEYPRIKYEGPSEQFQWRDVMKWISRSLMRGTDLAAAEGAKALENLPPGVIEFFRWRHAPLRDHGHQFVRHQLFGSPRVMQSRSAELARSHVLLFQFDSDGPMHWMWGDVGSLQFWITREDLRGRKFDNVLCFVDG